MDSNITFEWISAGKAEVLKDISSNPGYEWPHADEYFDELVYLKRALVAFDSGEPIGYLLYQNIWGNTPFLSQVWIKSEYHGQRIASKMIHTLEERLRTEGYDSLLTSNETKNNAGIGLMKKLGFEEIGILEMSHGPEVFSVKRLS